MEESVRAKDLGNYVGRQIILYGDLITAKKTGTSNGKYMYFGTFFDADATIFDTVQFPASAEKYPLRNKGIYKCYGKVNKELDYISISITKLIRQETLGDPRVLSTYR